MASAYEGSQKELKILIIGKTGSGKSTLGNGILGEEVFGTQAGMEMKTKGHQSESKNFQGSRLIRVVDTPDIECFSNIPKVEQENINVWKAVTDQDPDAILYTVRCDDNYEDSTHEKYKKIKKLWGPGFCEKLIVAFTFGENRVSIQENIERAGQHLQEVLDDANQRYVMFNSRSRLTEQVEKLIDMMLKMRPHSAAGAAPPPRPSRRDTSHTNDERKLSVVIIGSTKTGKTKLSSEIVGKQLHYSNNDATSATAKIGSTDITVVDTPDLTESSTLDPKDQVSKWKELSGSEPYVILAVRFDRQYTTKDLELYKMVKTIWGENDFKRRFAVVFTFVDKKEGNILEKLGPEFKEVLTDVNQRYVFFDDKTAESGKQIVPRMVKLFESTSSLGAAAMASRDVAMNATETTRTHGHSGHSTMDGILAVQSPRKDLSILVIGKAGTGKSSLANAILQKREFEVAAGMTIQTKTAAKGSGCFDDLSVKVVDTPDITNLSGEASKQGEFRKWCNLINPGPDVILLTVRCDSKYTPEDFAMYKELQSLGMKSVLEQKLFVVFTFGDQRQPDFEGDVRRAGSNLRAVMKDARGRRHLYNDKVTSSEKAAFVRELLRMVARSVSKN